MKKTIFTNILIFRPVMIFLFFSSIYALKQKSIESKTEKKQQKYDLHPSLLNRHVAQQHLLQIL